MIVWPPAERPMVFAFFLFNRQRTHGIAVIRTVFHSLTLLTAYGETDPSLSMVVTKLSRFCNANGKKNSITG